MTCNVEGEMSVVEQKLEEEMREMRIRWRSWANNRDLGMCHARRMSFTF